MNVDIDIDIDTDIDIDIDRDRDRDRDMHTTGGRGVILCSNACIHNVDTT